MNKNKYTCKKITGTKTKHLHKLNMYKNNTMQKSGTCKNITVQRHIIQKRTCTT